MEGFPAADSEEFKDMMDSNKMAMFKALDESMHIAHRKDQKDREEAVKTAKILISYADLPLLFRCRALMILGCSEEPGYVEWAQEAVRIAELGMRGVTSPTEADQKLLANCKEVLKNAQEDFAEAGGYGEEAAEEDVADTDAELVYDSEVAQVTATEGVTTGSGETTAPKKSTKARRIDSGRDVEQEWDEEKEMWVDVKKA